MLLTVIAVATLLVAVVGATFAYFSLSVGGNATTTANVTTAKIGSATFNQGTENLTLTITAEDMVKGDTDKTYYAVAGTEDNSGSHGESTPIPLASVTLTGGEEGNTYNCATTVDVDVKGTMLEKLETGWVTLALTGDAGTKTIDIASLKTGGKDQVTGSITLTGAEVSEQNVLNATLSLVNKADTLQNAIAGTSLTATIKLSGGVCTLQGE